MPLAWAPASKVSTPSFTDQAAGAFLALKPRQPLVDLPSNSSFQPAFFSSGVNVLGLGSAAKDQHREQHGSHERDGQSEGKA